MEGANDNTPPEGYRGGSTWPIFVLTLAVSLAIAGGAGAGVAYVVESFGGNYWPTFTMVSVPAFLFVFIAWRGFQMKSSSDE